MIAFLRAKASSFREFFTIFYYNSKDGGDRFFVRPVHGAGECTLRESAKSKVAVILMIALVGAILPVTAQTNLTMADPDALARAISSKAEIERSIILASPSSLADAREGLAQSKVIAEDERRAMMEIIRGLFDAALSSNRECGLFY